jgi:hypothetical protein
VAIQLLTAAGIALACLARRLSDRLQEMGDPQRPLLALLLALGCCWMTVFGPAAESSTYVLLAPAAAWALLEAWRSPQSVWVRVGAAVSYGLLLLPQVMAWFPFGRSFHTLGPQPLAGLLLFGWLLGQEAAFWSRRSAEYGEGAAESPARAA